MTVYGETDQLVENALTRVQEVMPDNEAIFGPFLHPRLIVYITDGGGGMEYCGATMTSEPAIRHELTHSWYARGVAPADGNAGWIDEAIATWRDSDFPSDSATPDRPPVNLAAFSPYNRVTPDESYSDGAKLMAELDFLTGGLKPLLKRFYLAHQRRLYTTDLFRRYLEKQSGLDLSAIFERYVYGKGTPLPEQAMASMVRYYHPRPYSLEELRRYR